MTLNTVRAFSLASLPSSSFAQTTTQTGSLTIDFKTAGPDVGPLIYGIFFEEINRAGNGGKSGSITGKGWVLTSAGPRDENSFDAPTRVMPKSEGFSAAASSFKRTFPPNPVTILRWK